MKINFDIDIDMANRDDFLSLVKHTPASIEKDGNFTKHNTGVYFQNIPQFPLEGYSTVEHKQAESNGWLKVDFLNNSVYSDIRDEAHLDKLLAMDTFWDLLQHHEVVSQLYHVSNYLTVLQHYKPTSVEQLAMILAIIRPGKKHLLGKTFDEIKQTVWVTPESGEYYFKKAHAIAFATAIVVQLNRLVEMAGQQRAG